MFKVIEPNNLSAVSSFVRLVSLFYIPGLWWLRGKIFIVFLYFLDVFFRYRDNSKEKLYTVKAGQYKFEVRKGTSDPFVIDEVWSKKVYGDIPTGEIIDLGANIGAYTIYAASNSTRVIAVEAISQNYERLIRNLKINQLENVLPINSFASSSQGTVEVYYHNVNNGMSSAYNKGRSNLHETVKKITFENIFNKFNLDRVSMLKCDVEGGEFDIFKGDNLAYLKYIDFITMEIHCNYASQKEFLDLLKNLSEAGFFIECKDVWFLLITGTGLFNFYRP